MLTRLTQRVARSSVLRSLVSAPRLSLAIAQPCSRILSQSTARFSTNAKSEGILSIYDIAGEKEAPTPSLFRSKEDIERRIYALVIDLFEGKLAPGAVNTVSGATPSSERVTIVDDQAPFNKLGLDSLDIVELLVAVEKEFHMELDDEDYAGVKNVFDIVHIIHTHPRAH